MKIHEAFSGHEFLYIPTEGRRIFAEKNEWLGLGMPQPGELLASLEKGEPQEVCGHRLSPDEHGVWITNPYGVDCGLWQTLSLEKVKVFLTDLALGKEYGPVPE